MLIPPTLPLIDISPFLIDPNSDEAKQVDLNELKKAVAETLHDACKNVGFFYLIGHGVDTAQSKKVHDLAKQFFSLPVEAKEKISIEHSDLARGYQKLGQNVTQYAKVLIWIKNV